MFMFNEIKEILMLSKKNNVDSKSIPAGVEKVLSNILGASLIRKIDLVINNIMTEVKMQRESFPENQYVVVLLDLIISCSKEFKI